MARPHRTHKRNSQSGNESVNRRSTPVEDRAGHDRRRQWRVVSELAYRTPELRHCVRLVDELAAIHARHPVSAGVWPKQSTLADLLDRDVSVVKRQLRALAAHGLIVKTVRQAYPDPDHEGRLVRPANYYRANLARCRQLRDEHRDRILARARKAKDQAREAVAAGRAYGAPMPPQSPPGGEVTRGAVPEHTPPPPPPASTSPENDPPAPPGADYRAARAALDARRPTVRGRRC